jgi:hypothetical protein
MNILRLISIFVPRKGYELHTVKRECNSLNEVIAFACTNVSQHNASIHYGESGMVVANWVS